MNNRSVINRFPGILIIVLMGIFIISTVKGFAAETDAQRIKGLERLTRNLIQHKRKIGIISQMNGIPLEEVKAVAGILWPPIPGLAIDLTSRSGAYSLRDPVKGSFMIHFSERPSETNEDIIYFVAADTLESTGMNFSKLSKLPALGKMTPRTWYYYDGQSIEPHHKSKLGRAYIVLALDIR